MERSQSNNCMTVQQYDVATLGDRFLTKNSPIRVQNKCNVSHFTIGWSFLELDTQFVESLTSLLDIVDGNGNMTKSSTRIRVSIGVSLEVGV
jgi:hypothetical protein